MLHKRTYSHFGGLGGGNVRSALVEQGAGFAQQDFQNQFGRLGQIAGQGQAATTSIGQFGAQTAGNIANLGVAGSEARASGILGAQQARSNTVGQIAGLAGTALGQFAPQPFSGVPSSGGGMSNFSDVRLKDNIKKVDSDENGGIYEFSYIGSAKKFIGRIAQELASYKPEAVSVHKSGYLQVNDEFAARAL